MPYFNSLSPIPTTYYLLPTTYYLLPTTYYLLPTTIFILLLPFTFLLLSTTTRTTHSEIQGIYCVCDLGKKE